MFYQIQTTRTPPKGPKMLGFLSQVTLTFDLQTRLSEGPSSVWIWRKSLQRFPRYYIHKQKKSTDWLCQKQNLLQFTACGNISLLQLSCPQKNHDSTKYETV